MSERSRFAFVRPSVTEMKTPFPLLLPESPSATEDDSTTSDSSPGLRRMSTSYNDLRAVAQRHACPTKSPTMPQIARASVEGDFPSPHSWGVGGDPVDNLDSPDNLQILSYYCDDSDGSSYPSESTDDQKDTLHDDGLSLDSEPSPMTPLDHEYSATLCSDESGWLANTTSHDERVERFKARYYQVVQRAWVPEPGEPGEDELLIATVLVGPGKPRLVQIQRPHSRQAASNLFPETESRPMTPVRTPAEVSAFSPYDTPDDGLHDQREVSRIDMVTRFDAAGFAISPERPKTVNRGVKHRLQGLDDPFEMSPLRSWRGRPSWGSGRWHFGGELRMTVCQSRTGSPPSHTAAWSRRRKLERAVHSVSHAIDTFPDGMLRLDSPVVLELRSPHVRDQTYIQVLHKIFPTAPPLLISALTAWILVDLYFSKWHDLSSCSNANTSGPRVPEKAREMLGMGTWDQVSAGLNEYTLRRRAGAVHAGIGAIGRKLIEALRGAWDDDIWRSVKVLVEVIETHPRIW